MKKLKNPEKIEKMRTLAKKHGVLVDRWGNVKYNLSSGKQVRFHFKKNVVRLEIKYPGDTRWYYNSSVLISIVSLPMLEERMKYIASEE
jgi:hypothetical protein